MSESTYVSEPFRNVPNTSEPLGTIPNAAEDFRTLPKTAERKEKHTLTVREVARMFESAGVARTERSIINWCQPNKLGIPRLDSFFDPNERRYFITPQSVELAIKEEQAKAAKSGSSFEPVGTIPEPYANRVDVPSEDEDDNAMRSKTVRQEIMDLKITNRAKDMFIEQLKSEREGFVLERKDYIERLIDSNRRIGKLETQLLQLGAPSEDARGDVVSTDMAQ